MTRINILKKLVSIPSYEEHSEGRCAVRDYIFNFLLKLKSESDSLEMVDNNIIFSKKGTKLGKISLILHYDTVKGVNNLLKSKNGNYYGLGVTSAKAALATVLNVIYAQRRLKPTQGYNLIVTCDEVTGSTNGTINLVNNYYEKITSDFVWIPDCTDKYISIGSFSTLCISIHLKGKGGHPVYTSVKKESSAIHGSCQLITNLEDFFETISNKYSVGNYSPIFSITSVKICDQPNILPSNGEITLDLRIHPSLSVTQLVHDIRKFLLKNKIVNSINHKYYEGFIVDAKNKYVEDFIKKACSIKSNGLNLKTKVERGSHDAVYWAVTKGIPVIGYLPGGENLHKKNECVSKAKLDELEKLFKILIYEK